MSLSWPGRASFDNEDWKKNKNKTATKSGFFDLSAPVGMGGASHRDDVVKVEGLLANTGHYDLKATEGPTGYAGARLDDAIKRYQGDNGLKVDGLLNPRGPTLASLGERLGSKLKHHRPPTAREVDRHHETIAKGKPALISYRPAQAKILPSPDLLRISGTDFFANDKTLDALRRTSDFGDLPKYLAEDMVSDGVKGVARVRDLVARTGTEIGEPQQRDLLEGVLAHLPRDQQKILLGGEPPEDRPLGVSLEGGTQKPSAKPAPATDTGPKAWAQRLGAHGKLTKGLAEWVADTARSTAPQARADLETFAKELHARDPKLAHELGERVMKNTGTVETQVAAVARDQRTGKPMLPGPKIPWTLEGSAGGVSPGTMPPSKALQAILWTLFSVGVAASNNTNEPRETPIHDGGDESEGIRSDGSAQRTVVEQDPGGTPGTPAEPPQLPEDQGNLPPNLPADLTIGTPKPVNLADIPSIESIPIPERQGPLLEILPDQSRWLNKPLIVENRGTPLTEQRTTNAIDAGTEAAVEDKVDGTEHFGGGLNEEGGRVKETHLPPHTPTPGRSKTFGGSLIDGTIWNKFTKRFLYISTYTPKGTKTGKWDPIKREYNQAVKVYFNSKTGNLIAMIPKPPVGYELDMVEVKEFLRPLIHEIARPKAQRRDGIERDGEPKWHQMEPKRLIKQ